MKANITEQIYEYYIQSPRYKELRKHYDYNISNPEHVHLINDMGEDNYLKAQEMAVYISGNAEKVGFILGFQIGSKLTCETIDAWEGDTW